MPLNYGSEGQCASVETLLHFLQAPLYAYARPHPGYPFAPCVDMKAKEKSNWTGVHSEHPEDDPNLI